MGGGKSPCTVRVSELVNLDIKFRGMTLGERLHKAGNPFGVVQQIHIGVS